MKIIQEPGKYRLLDVYSRNLPFVCFPLHQGDRKSLGQKETGASEKPFATWSGPSQKQQQRGAVSPRPEEGRSCHLLDVWWNERLLHRKRGS